MRRLHARYPFLAAAREAVEEADVDLAALVEGGDPAVDRAVERVENALTGTTVGEPHRSTRTELLSYPVARVLVSLLDRPALVRRYADAEARTAHERFEADLADGGALQSAEGERITLRELLAEFDLAGAVREDGDRFLVHVGAYLRLAADLDGSEWRLSSRPLSDGEVPVGRPELLALLREAVRERVADGLPFPEVPEPVAAALDPQVEHVQSLLADHRPPGRVDAVVPELFPPCATALLRRARDGEDLPHHARFALVTFLASAGLSPEEVAAQFPDGGAADAAAHQAERLASERGAAYPPPSCATMQSLGDCVPSAERDDRCESIPDPLSYYAAAVADADDVEEWSGEGDASLVERV